METTVLQYVKLEFRGEWGFDYQNSAYMPADQSGELIVLRESPAGTLETYWFTVPRRDGAGVELAVIAPPVENIVYIPELCVRRKSGDHTEGQEDTREGPRYETGYPERESSSETGYPERESSSRYETGG
jgi:hypothetical protein